MEPANEVKTGVVEGKTGRQRDQEYGGDDLAGHGNQIVAPEALRGTKEDKGYRIDDDDAAQKPMNMRTMSRHVFRKSRHELAMAAPAPEPLSARMATA